MSSDQDAYQESPQDNYEEPTQDGYGENELQKNSRIMLGLVTLFVVAVVAFVVAQHSGEILGTTATEQATPVAASHVPPPPPATGKWDTRIETNPLDDTKTVILAVEAADLSSPQEPPVQLLLRCTLNKTDIIIQWGKLLDVRGTSVSTRMGQAAPQTEPWNLSTDTKSTFYTGDKNLFINDLVATNRFIAQTTPLGENPLTAIFDVNGLDKAIEPARQICGW